MSHLLLPHLYIPGALSSAVFNLNLTILFQSVLLFLNASFFVDGSTADSHGDFNVCAFCRIL